MKRANILAKFLLISSVIGIVSCQTAPASVSFGVETTSIQLGKADQSGSFVAVSDKTFTAQDKIFIKVKAVGLTIIKSQIKANVDIFLKKGTDVLGTQTDILGTAGLTQTISGVDQTYTGSSGKADLQLTISPPSDTKGDIVANITVKDLNAPGKLATFETSFILK